MTHVATTVDASSAPQGSDRPLHRSLTDEATGRVDVRRFNGMDDFVETHATRGHAFRIDLHLELPEIPTEALDGRDTRHREQPILHLELRQIAQPHQIRCAWLCLERELENLVQSSGDARQERRFSSRWELSANLIDSLRHELTRAALGRLAPRDAEILALKYGQRWSYRQIAERLGITEKAVDARMQRARERLRQELARRGIQGEDDL